MKFLDLAGKFVLWHSFSRILWILKNGGRLFYMGHIYWLSRILSLYQFINGLKVPIVLILCSYKKTVFLHLLFELLEICPINHKHYFVLSFTFLEFNKPLYKTPMCVLVCIYRKHVVQWFHSAALITWWYMVFVFFVLGGCSTGVWTWGFVLCTLYLLGRCLSHASSPFYSGYFGDRVSLFAQAHLDCNLF
jgi:hypothetical protein